MVLIVVAEIDGVAFVVAIVERIDVLHVLDEELEVEEDVGGGTNDGYSSSLGSPYGSSIGNVLINGADGAIDELVNGGIGIGCITGVCAGV